MFKRILAVCGVLALAAIPSMADLTLGVNPATYPGSGAYDTSPFGLFAYQLVPSVNGTDNVLSSWSFYGLTVNPVAPVIYSGSLTSGSGSLEIVWVGSTVTPLDSGVHTYSITGAPTLTAGEYLGWQDGVSAGNIALTGQGYGLPNGNGISYDNNPGGPAVVGASYTFTASSTDQRNYYAEFALTGAPEPAFYGIMALGLSGLAILISRRKKLKA